ADLQAVEARQHEVEDDQVVATRFGLGEAGDAVVDEAAFAAELGELQRNQAADVGVVLDDEHAPRHRAAPGATATSASASDQARNVPSATWRASVAAKSNAGSTSSAAGTAAASGRPCASARRKPSSPAARTRNSTSHSLRATSSRTPPSSSETVATASSSTSARFAHQIASTGCGDATKRVA